MEQVGLKDSWKDTVVVVEDSLAVHRLVDIPKVAGHKHLEDSGCRTPDMHVASGVLRQAVVDTGQVDRTFAAVMLERLVALAGSFPVAAHLGVLVEDQRWDTENLVEVLNQK